MTLENKNMNLFSLNWKTEYNLLEEFFLSVVGTLLNAYQIQPFLLLSQGVFVQDHQEAL